MKIKLTEQEANLFFELLISLDQNIRDLKKHEKEFCILLRQDVFKTLVSKITIDVYEKIFSSCLIVFEGHYKVGENLFTSKEKFVLKKQEMLFLQKMIRSFFREITQKDSSVATLRMLLSNKKALRKLLECFLEKNNVKN